MREAECASSVSAPVPNAIVPILLRGLCSKDVRVGRCWRGGCYTGEHTLCDVGQSNQVAVYIRRLRTKLEPNPDEPRHLLTTRGIGYKFEAGG